MDTDFAVICPLVRHRMPQIQFLYISSRLCSTLLSGPASQRVLFHPCASLSLHVHYVVKRTFTSKRSNIARHAKKTPALAGGFCFGFSLGGSGGVSPEIFVRCGSPYFLDPLLSTNFCEGLNGLSFRWTQPYQQQGRRIPSLSSEHTRSTCSRRFSACLTEKTQQIHSFRASGVISSHAVSALESEAKAFRKSAGRSCATPPGIFLVIRKLYTGAPAMVLARALVQKIALPSWRRTHFSYSASNTPRARQRASNASEDVAGFWCKTIPPALVVRKILIGLRCSLFKSVFVMQST